MFIFALNLKFQFEEIPYLFRFLAVIFRAYDGQSIAIFKKKNFKGHIVRHMEVPWLGVE